MTLQDAPPLSTTVAGPLALILAEFDYGLSDQMSLNMRSARTSCHTSSSVSVKAKTPPPRSGSASPLRNVVHLPRGDERARGSGLEDVAMPIQHVVAR